MLKLKLTKDEYDQLDEAQKSFYAENGDEFTLQVDGLEDTGALKRAKDHEKEARKLAQEKARELESRLKSLEEAAEAEKEKLELEAAKKAGNFEELKASYEKKTKEIQAKYEAQMSEFKTSLANKELDALASSIAQDLAKDNAGILLPHVKQRLKVEYGDDGLITQVLDEKGQVSADSVDELKNYFSTSDAFAAIVVGSEASGGGAAGGSKGSIPKKKLSEMTATEEAQFANQNPQEYQRLLEQEG